MRERLLIDDFVKLKKHLGTDMITIPIDEASISLQDLECMIKEEFAIGDQPIECHTAHHLTEKLSFLLDRFCTVANFRLITS